MDSGALLSATLNEVADQSNQFSCLWLSTIDVNNYGGGNQIGNTAFGPGALTSNSTSRYNIAIGLDALHSQTGSSGTGGSNVAIGPNALYTTNNSNGVQNIAIGYESQYSANGGGDNVSIGVNSLYTNVSGNNNISIGTSALYSSISSNNVAVGYFALNELTHPSTGNVSIGSESLKHFSGNLSTVHINTAVGYQSLRGKPASVWSNTGNTGVGYQTLLFIDSNGQYNTAIGHQSQMGTTGNGAGYGNTSVGYHSLFRAMASSNYNTVMGMDAGEDITTGSYNTILGYYTGKLIITGQQNIVIGSQNLLTATTTGTSMIGVSDTATGNNQMRFGSTTVTNGAVTSGSVTQNEYWNVFINGVAKKIMLGT
jgi:hypothetical protein